MSARPCAYGGQALIEGLMIKGPDRTAIAVRTPDGEISVKKVHFQSGGWSKRVPLLRGVVEFFRMNVQGIRALFYSASLAEEEGFEEESPGSWMLWAAAVFGIAFSVGLFLLLPNLVTGLLFARGGPAAAFTEGALRLVLFTAYLWLVSRMSEMRRIWMYHGAEHKTIHCFEHGKALTVDNVRGYTTLHPRCGTSFLFLVMIVSALLFSAVGWHGLWGNLLLRLALVPVVAGVSYELFRIVGRRDNALTRALRVPGLAFQRLTTSEPDDRQIEVAIAAFSAAQTAGGEEAW